MILILYEFLGAFTANCPDSELLTFIVAVSFLNWSFLEWQTRSTTNTSKSIGLLLKSMKPCLLKTIFERT